MISCGLVNENVFCAFFSQYLNKNDITDVTLENFSFSTKLHIGEFLECKEVCVALLIFSTNLELQ